LRVERLVVLIHASGFLLLLFITLQCEHIHIYIYEYMKSSDAKAFKCHLKFSSLMMIFLSNLYV